MLNISMCITPYFYCSYQGEAKKNFRMLLLVLRAVGLHNVQSQIGGVGMICSWGNWGVDNERDIYN